MALVVVALVVGAMLHSASVTSRAEYDLEERFFARWVALDQLTHLKLMGEAPEIGLRTGERQLASRTWKWEASIFNTPEPGIYRVEMVVLNDRQQEVASINGYLGELPNEVHGGEGTRTDAD